MRATKNGDVIVLRQKNLRAALRELAKRGIQRVLLEGGGHALGCAFDEKLVQEVVFCVAPILSGGGVPAVGGLGADSTAKALRLDPVAYRRLGRDLRISGRLEV